MSRDLVDNPNFKVEIDLRKSSLIPFQDYMNRRMTKGMFHWIGLAKFNEQQQPQWQAVGK